MRPRVTGAYVQRSLRFGPELFQRPHGRDCCFETAVIGKRQHLFSHDLLLAALRAGRHPGRACREPCSGAQVKTRDPYRGF